MCYKTYCYERGVTQELQADKRSTDCFISFLFWLLQAGGGIQAGKVEDRQAEADCYKKMSSKLWGQRQAMLNNRRAGQGRKLTSKQGYELTIGQRQASTDWS